MPAAHGPHQRECGRGLRHPPRGPRCHGGGLPQEGLSPETGHSDGHRWTWNSSPASLVVFLVESSTGCPKGEHVCEINMLNQRLLFWPSGAGRKPTDGVDPKGNRKNTKTENQQRLGNRVLFQAFSTPRKRQGTPGESAGRAEPGRGREHEGLKPLGAKHYPQVYIVPKEKLTGDGNAHFADLSTPGKQEAKGKLSRDPVRSFATFFCPSCMV